MASRPFTGRCEGTAHGSICATSTARSSMATFARARTCWRPTFRSSTSRCSIANISPQASPFTRRSRNSRGARRISSSKTRMETSSVLQARPTSKTRSLYPQGKVFKAQFPDRAAIGRNEIRLRQLGAGKSRQQARDRNHDRRSAENIADAMVRPGAEGQDPLRVAVDVEAERIRKDIGIVVRGLGRGPHHHARQNLRPADLRVAGRDAGEGEIPVAGKSQAFLDRRGNEARLADQLCELVGMGIERVEGAARRPAGGGERSPADGEYLVEQFPVGELVALVARRDEIVDEVRPRIGAPLGDDPVDQLTGALERPLALRRKPL